MSAIPEPSAEIRAARMLTTAELVAGASELTEHGKELLIGGMAGYTDPIVRRAFTACLRGAQAGQGLKEPPRPAETKPDGPECKFCHHSDVPLMGTMDGFQCLDGIDCYGRQDGVASS